jgi:hypothetical protein
MPTCSTGHDLTAFCIALAERIKCGIRMVLHAFVDDLLPLGIKPRWIATSMGLRGIITCTGKTPDQRSNNTRADGTTLG